MHASREKVIFARLHAAWTREITTEVKDGPLHPSALFERAREKADRVLDAA